MKELFVYALIKALSSFGTAAALFFDYDLRRAQYSIPCPIPVPYDPCDLSAFSGHIVTFFECFVQSMIELLTDIAVPLDTVALESFQKLILHMFHP